VFPVSLLLEYQHTRISAWSNGCWQVIAAVAGQHGLSQGRSAVPIHEDEHGRQILCRGYQLTLHRDDAESYYCNLIGERPSLFVVCREENGERPEPALVTASYGEAASYSEVDENVYAVPMPPVSGPVRETCHTQRDVSGNKHSGRILNCEIPCRYNKI